MLYRLHNIRVGTGEKKSKEDERTAFTFDDISILLDGLKPTGFADMVRLGLIAGGGRSGELASLRPEHISKKDDGFWIDLPGTKTDSAPRLVPISKMFDPFIQRLTDEAGEFLIPLYPDKSWETDKRRNDYINKELNRKRRDLPIVEGHRKTFHSTRYTYIELLEQAGVAISTAKLLVGHKRTDITFGSYSSGNLVDLRESVEKMRFPADISSQINASD